MVFAIKRHLQYFAYNSQNGDIGGLLGGQYGYIDDNNKY
jgi:hypothetical protein